MKRLRKKVSKSFEEPVPVLRIKKRNEPIKTVNKDWNLWVSASSTRNFLIKDPLLDWLSYHSTKLSQVPKYKDSIVKAIPRKNTFTEFIMQQGNEFETKVIDYLYQYLGKDVFKDIGGNFSARSEMKVLETIEAMNIGVPIIYQGVLHNSENCTYGVPDLIVRSDWLCKLVQTSPIIKEDENIPAPLLKDVFNPGKPPNYHYRIVDIKFTTLPLRADGIHLLNSGSIPAYKGQLWIYNKALALIQGYEPPCAYILGRKWKYTSKGTAYKGVSCIEKLGVINYAKVDLEYPARTIDAIRWIKEMRRDGGLWNITVDIPLIRKELYPNMSNHYDYPWHGTKKIISDEIKEITSLWMCGTKQRDIAFSKGIHKWTDPRCTAASLGITGEKTSPILDAIININKQSSHLILPLSIKNNDEGWQTKQTLEFYVDFEFINDVVNDFSTMPNVEARSIIFMIGVGYFEHETNIWRYREFTVNQLTKEDEARICSEFSSYISTESEFWECDNPLLIHWSNAENWQWEDASKRHKNVKKAWIPPKSQGQFLSGWSSTRWSSPRWFDLLQVFKNEPIVIKDCLGFGLKEVATTLYKHGVIKSTWDGESACVDGSSAMLAAYHASIDAKNRNIGLKEMPLMQDIIKYNEIDCKVVGEIICFLREKYVDDIILFE